MALQRTAVGLDIGSRFLRALQVRVSGTEARAERCFSAERRALAAEGPDGTDLRQLAFRLREKMAEAGLRTRELVLAIDPQESILRYLHMPPVPPRRLELVMKYEVEAVGERMGESVASDFALLSVLRDVDEDRNLLLALAKEGPLEELLRAFESAGMPVARLVPAPVALWGAWDLFGAKADPDAPGDDLVLAADLGARNLHVALVLNNRLAFARSATFGGDNFTQAVAGALRVDLERAERVKITRGGLDESIGGVLADTVAPLRSAAGQLLGMLQSSLRLGGGQIGVKLPPCSRLWLTGGGMRLRGLPQYLGRGLGNVPVEVFDPTVGDGGGEPPANVGLAAGLCAAGLGVSRGQEGAVELNVLPRRYQARRRFLDRTLYLYVAASFLVVLLAAQLVLGVVRNWSAAADLQELESRLAELEARGSEMVADIERSTRSRAMIDRLLVEAEPTAFQAFVLDLLGRNLRPEIQIEKIWLEAYETESEHSKYLLLLEGRVNNERRKAHDWILELLEMLRREERVRDVNVRSNVERGAWVRFTMEVDPNSVSS